MRRYLLVLLLLSGCSSLTIDLSPSAVASNDLTLISSCVAAPGPSVGLASGVDACRFSRGDAVASFWTLIAPKPKTASHVVSGSVDVFMKDVHKTYAVSDWVVRVPFADFFGPKWSSDENQSVAEALVSIQWVDNEGINQVTSFKGIAVILVLAPGYSRLPIDSATQAWGTTCKVQSSTAGRTALQCL